MNFTTLIVYIPFAMSIGQAIWSNRLFKKYDIQLNRTWNLNTFSRNEWEQIEMQATEKCGEANVEHFKTFYKLCLLSWAVLLLWFVLSIFI